MKIARFTPNNNYKIKKTIKIVNVNAKNNIRIT